MAVLSAPQIAWASEPATVLAMSLGLFALIGGAVAGMLAAVRPDRIRFRPAFLAWLALLAVTATTRARSMEALPLALVLGTVLGILPFAASYVLVRAIGLRLKRRA